MSIRVRKPGQRGSTLIEFAFIAFTLFMVVFAGIEFIRMALVFTSVANSARAGVRYAIVHGHGRHDATTGDPESGPGANPAPVVTVVQNFASSGSVRVSLLPAACGSPQPAGVCVTYPDGDNDPGSRVVVTVAYRYDPFTVLPLGVMLRSTSEGRIAF